MDLLVSESCAPWRLTWQTVHAHPSWHGTRVRFELSDNGNGNGNGTELAFSHVGWREITPFVEHCNFAWARYLQSLKDYCETGAGDPYSENKAHTRI